MQALGSAQRLSKIQRIGKVTASATAPLGGAGGDRLFAVIDIGVVGIERRLAVAGQGLRAGQKDTVGHGLGLAVGRFVWCPGRVRHQVLGRHRTVLGALEKRVLFQLLLDEGGKLDIRILQQLDCLLQLRRHDQALTQPLL